MAGTIPCRVCSQPAAGAFVGVLMGRHTVRYYHCAECGFLQTEEPDWLDEAYADPINLADTGLVARNLMFADEAAVILYFFFDRTARFVDYAGGYGLFTRLMRDIGFDFRCSDPHTPNLLARGFEARPGETGVELVTAFECLEHFPHPLQELERMLAMSRNILFSTELLPSPIPDPEEWWYYGLDHGQHVSFYSRRTLEHVARRYGLRLYKIGALHLLTAKEIDPRLLWVVRRLRGRWLLRHVRRHMHARTQEDHALMSRQRGALER